MKFEMAAGYIVMPSSILLHYVAFIRFFLIIVIFSDIVEI